jgi:hypothetical protein
MLMVLLTPYRMGILAGKSPTEIPKRLLLLVSKFLKATSSGVMVSGYENSALPDLGKKHSLGS